MVVFVDVTGKTTLNDSVKQMSFEQLKETFEGKLDYVSLAKQLGIKPAPKSKENKPEFKPKDAEKSDK